MSLMFIDFILRLVLGLAPCRLCRRLGLGRGFFAAAWLRGLRLRFAAGLAALAGAGGMRRSTASQLRTRRRRSAAASVRPSCSAASFESIRRSCRSRSYGCKRVRSHQLHAFEVAAGQLQIAIRRDLHQQHRACVSPSSAISAWRNSLVLCESERPAVHHRQLLHRQAWPKAPSAARPEPSCCGKR